MTRFSLFAVLVFCAAGNAAQAQTKKDQEVIQGTWTVVTVMDGGRNRDNKGAKMQFKGNVISVIVPGRKEPDVTFKLDSTKKPRWIDIMPKKDRVLRGIYEIKGEELRICVNERPNGERSDRFESVANSPNDLFFVLRRAK